MFWKALALLAAGMAPAVGAEEFDTHVDMLSRDAATFYVQGAIGGLGAVDLMVDTGSGYMTINEEMLSELKRQGGVRYLSQVRGRLANGDELSVPLYSISRVNIGGNCWLRDVEAAVFPGGTRAILGLSALKQASPFIFSMDPPRLVLSHCAGRAEIAES
ncbi:retropepsin-like aspartic protease family protein [Marinobacterium aestuariivivens]|uniref:TIGR02281 family clan AA aspartic protease n=1 Tax=Marinobacterium aestuariivivens TaxID=1698799 RepID=A0ABW2A8U5_9GAMM